MKDSNGNLNDIEDKSTSLHNILTKESEYQLTLRRERYDEDYEVNLDLKFEGEEKQNEIPDDYAIFFHRNEQLIQQAKRSISRYEWVHLSCASWIPGIHVTPKTPVKLTNKMERKRFDLRCIICLTKDGACIQC